MALGTPEYVKEIDFKIRSPNYSSIINSPRRTPIKVVREEAGTKSIQHSPQKSPMKPT